jgi:hypothetical protein
MSLWEYTSSYAGENQTLQGNSQNVEKRYDPPVTYAHCWCGVATCFEKAMSPAAAAALTALIISALLLSRRTAMRVFMLPPPATSKASSPLAAQLFWSLLSQLLVLPSDDCTAEMRDHPCNQPYCLPGQGISAPCSANCTSGKANLHSLWHVSFPSFDSCELALLTYYSNGCTFQSQIPGDCYLCASYMHHGYCHWPAALH